VYALLRDRRAPFLMAAGAVPPALLLAGYNWVSFGSPVSLGYTNLVHPGFATAMGQGVLGVTLPKAAVLHEILLGPRGLLRLSPWLLFAPLGLWAARRPDVRREVVLCASIVLMYLVSNAGYHEPLGGWSPGPRFLITALPFATILVALAPRILRPVILILAACSVALVTVATATMPNAPTKAKDPLIEFWLPRLMTGYPAETTAWLYWGLHGSQPLLILGLAATIAVAALWATARPTRLASGLAGVGIGTLGLLLAAFGLPVDLAGSLGLGGSAGDSRAAIAIVRAGVIPVPMDDGRPNVAPWAQLENRGRASDATIVLFAIYAPGGERVWSDSHRVAGWRAKERKRLGAQWSPRDAPPGDYRVEVMVMPPDQRRTIARMRNVATIRVFEGGYEVRRD
jgi:hypothetical protein